MMKRSSSQEKSSSCKPQQTKSSRFGAREFSLREDSDISSLPERPLPGFNLMDLPLNAPVQEKPIVENADLEYGRGANREAGGLQTEAVQRQADPEMEEDEDEDEVLQGKFELSGVAAKPEQAEPRPNRTGMPDRLKAGIESLSGIDMSDVRVHANSPKPAGLNALAYTQGNQIYLGPGEERHLPHEAWHVVQQKQGRVRATGQMKRKGINDDVDLEREADLIGARALQMKAEDGGLQRLTPSLLGAYTERDSFFQRHAQGSGLTRALNSGMERLSEMGMDDVEGNYNSAKTAQLQAHACAQSTDIQPISSQETQRSHELWHVVQQEQCRLQPTMQAEGVKINNDPSLEREAGTMGHKVLQQQSLALPIKSATSVASSPIQRVLSEAEIGELLKRKKESKEDLSQSEMADILAYLRVTNHASSGAREILTLLHNFSLPNESELYKYLYPSGQTSRMTSRKRPTRHRSSRKLEVPLFEDSGSEVSASDELDMKALHKEYPKTYRPVLEHSEEGRRKRQRVGESPEEGMNAKNTNMMVFLDGSLIPRTTGTSGKINIDAHRKSKRQLAGKMQGITTNLRAYQESFSWSSSLKVPTRPGYEEGRSTTFLKNFGAELPDAVSRLLKYTMPGFAQGDAETHAEQSFVLSEAWTSLTTRLRGNLIDIASVTGAELGADEANGHTLTFVLNRSPCIECARALVRATIIFWKGVADALGLATWHEAQRAHGHMMRFVIQCPTIYMHNQEKEKNFRNLDSILRGLLEAGWQVESAPLVVSGGQESHNDLETRLNAIQSELSSKNSSSASASASERESSISEVAGHDNAEDSKEDYQGYQLLSANNCLIRALNEGAEATEAQLTNIRGKLFEQHKIDYGQFIPADENTIHVIAQELNIARTIVHIQDQRADMPAYFLIHENGNVETALDESQVNAEGDGYTYIIVNYADNHFEAQHTGGSLSKGLAPQPLVRTEGLDLSGLRGICRAAPQLPQDRDLPAV